MYLKRIIAAFCGMSVLLFLCVGCVSKSLPLEEAIKDEQSRYQEQMKHYPDRDSAQQQAQDIEQARKDDMLKKR